MKKIERAKETVQTLEEGNLKVDFLKTGDLFCLRHKDILINQIEGNLVDGSLNNIYLRMLDENNSVVDYIPLLGIDSNSEFSIGEKQAIWSGVFKEIEYEIRFILSDDLIWFWEINLNANGKRVDIIYTQDIGLATNGALKSNEAYISQYVDHKVIESETSYTVCSRQNQPQEEKFPFLQQGSLQGVSSFSTDGFQFFGKTFKETNEPEALRKKKLENKNYQYEFNYTALQSDPLEIDGEVRVTFYGKFMETHPEAVEKEQSIEEIRKKYEAITLETDLKVVEKIGRQPYMGSPLQTKAMTQEEIHDLYPKRVQEEYKEEKLLSFFTDTKEHVVLKEKEGQMERPHGQILFTHNMSVPNESIMSTTSWMYGIFNAQLVIGNTDMNKFLTNARNPLNILKSSGQRVYVEINGKYHLLAMPSLLEIGINHVKWYYKTSDETFVVTNYTSSDSSTVQLSVSSVSEKEYRYLVTNQLAMNNIEYLVPGYMEEKENILAFQFDRNTESAKQFPNLTYYMTVKRAESKVVGEEFLLEGLNDQSAMLVNLLIEPTSHFDIQMQGSLEGNSFEDKQLKLAEEKEKYHVFFKALSNHFELETNQKFDNLVEKLNLTVWWYTHNMLVHYLIPHGLEQFGGAAWGTRDVSQGPTEYFMAMQKYGTVKEIIKRVYSHQHTDGNWPQWFMFDHFDHIQSDESHGDVIVWPLKLLADYLEATNDFAILNQELPYYDKQTKEVTDYKKTILHHTQNQIGYIQKNFLWDTYLSSYGDGDWDDTLQPHDQSLKKNMASSWTIALTYQTLTKFSKMLEAGGIEWAAEVEELTTNIKSDFEKYLSSNLVIPGFIYMPDEHTVEKMIHPDDEKTGIQYRLLPMIRGMISELFTKEQAEQHYEIIQEHLLNPDGVRLMNRPATYNGGVSRHFKRAEQAANFGREIGLMYAHAHIRFIEAMAKIGKNKETWNGLETINPINIKEKVENAELRQSNVYFSSSDANFSDRYQAQENFELVKRGEVSVKGGWRIYSSGPGIYVNQLITNVLGIRLVGESMVFDPVLMKEMDGLILRFQLANKPVQIQYHYTDTEKDYVMVNKEKVYAINTTNSYRNTGLTIDKIRIEDKLSKENNRIDIFYTTSE